MENILLKKEIYFYPDTIYLAKLLPLFYGNLYDGMNTMSDDWKNSIMIIIGNIKKGINIDQNIRSVYMMLVDAKAPYILVNGDTRRKADFSDITWINSCYAMEKNYHIERRNLRLSFTRNIDVLSVYQKLTSFDWKNDNISVNGYIVINYNEENIDNQINAILEHEEALILYDTKTNTAMEFGNATVIKDMAEQLIAKLETMDTNKDGIGMSGNRAGILSSQMGKISYINRVYDTSSYYIFMREDTRLSSFLDGAKYGILLLVILIFSLSFILYFNHYMQSQHIIFTEIELLYGHAQINSHFLLNVMDTIYWKTIHKNGIETEESTMIEKLCLILKYSLDSSGNLASLNDEVNYSKLYLELQQIRKEIKMKVEWNIPDEILAVTTEKLITQPILENCIQHARKPGADVLLLIRVNSLIDRGNLSLYFEDNGKGMTNDDLCRLNEQLRRKGTSSSGHIGLANINRRLSLRYGDNYGIYLKHSDLGGLCVELKMRYDKSI